MTKLASRCWPVLPSLLVLSVRPSAHVAATRFWTKVGVHPRSQGRVTVAEDIELDNPFENLGAQLIKEAASKTNTVAGDGNNNGNRPRRSDLPRRDQDDRAGADPMALSRGIAQAVEAVSAAVLKMATPINDKNKKEIMQVATIAGNMIPRLVKSWPMLYQGW